MENLRTIIMGRQWKWVTLVSSLVGLGRYLHWYSYLVHMVELR